RCVRASPSAPARAPRGALRRPPPSAGSGGASEASDSGSRRRSSRRLRILGVGIERDDDVALLAGERGRGGKGGRARRPVCPAPAGSRARQAREHDLLQGAPVLLLAAKPRSAGGGQ